MTARLETIIRQKQLENSAAAIIGCRYPETHARVIEGMIILRTPGKVICLDLKASGRPLSRMRLNRHAKMRRLGYRVVTCRSTLEIWQAFNDLLAAARCEGQRAAYSHALDLAKSEPMTCAAEIESVMHELPR